VTRSLTLVTIKTMFLPLGQEVLSAKGIRQSSMPGRGGRKIYPSQLHPFLLLQEFG